MRDPISPRQEGHARVLHRCNKSPFFRVFRVPSPPPYTLLRRGLDNAARSGIYTPPPSRYHPAPLTARDREILVALTLKTRLLSLDQIARTWWKPTDSGRNEARKRMTELAAHGLVERRRMNIHPELPLGNPLLAWEPGDEDPNFGAIAYRLKIRWKESLRLTPFFTASKHGVKHFGGSRSAGGRLKRPHQVTHDLHVAALYLRFLQADPTAANAWTLDHHLTTERKNQKLPDAVLKNPDGRDGRVIEFGGAYPARRVEAFHEDCLRRSLPYELW